MFRFLLTFLLVAGLFGVMPRSAAATPFDGATEIHFPWVPFGSIIEDPRGFPDSGPYFGHISIQNLEDAEIIVFVILVRAYGEGILMEEPINFGPHESTTVIPEQMFVLPGVEGSAITLKAFIPAMGMEPAKIGAVMRTVSPVQSSPASETSSAQITVSGYTGLSEYGLGSPLTLPVAQTNSNWNTLIRVTNFQEVASHEIAVTLFPAGGGLALGPYIQNAPPGQTRTFDLLDLGVPEDWVGSAYITSDGPIAAIAERVKNETNMLIINPSRAPMQSSDTQVAGLVFRDWNFWNTGIAIQNLEAHPNEITIEFFEADGTLAHSETLVLPALRMNFVYLPASPPGEEEPFVGSALLSGDHPFHAVIDEVKYFGDDPDTGHAMSYTADYQSATAGQSLSLPLFHKGNPGTGGGDTSGIQIFGLEGEAQVEIEFFDEMGNSMPGAVIETTISQGEGFTAYSMFMHELPDGFTGSAVVRNVSLYDGPTTRIVAVSNLVNYDVEYDGSTSFNMMRFWIDPPF